MASENMDVLVSIRADGVESARAARQELEALGTSSRGAGDQVLGLSTAFERFEQRGPTRIIRQASFAFEGLAASAIGAQGPVSHVAATMLQFGIGGGVGLVAIGGFAAIAAEIEHIAGFADEADRNIRKLNTTIAAGTPAEGLFKAEDARDPAAQRPGLWKRFVGGLMGGRGMFGEAGFSPDITAAEDVTAAMTATTEEQDARGLTAGFHRRHQQIIDERDRRVDADRKRRADEAERRRKELDRQALIDAELGGFGGSGLGGAAPLGSNRLGFGTPPGRDLSLGFNERPRVPGALERDLGIDIKTLILGHPGAPPVDETFPATPKGIDFRRLAAAGVGFAGTVAGLGTANAAQKFGGLLTAGAGVAEVIPGGQLPGAVLAGLGGLISLFGSGKKPAVVIDEFGERAKEQLKEVGAYVQNGSVVVVSPTGGDALRAADYALQQAGRLDATPRLPVPLSR